MLSDSDKEWIVEQFSALDEGIVEQLDLAKVELEIEVNKLIGDLDDHVKNVLRLYKIGYQK